MLILVETRETVASPEGGWDTHQLEYTPGFLPTVTTYHFFW